ncbi:hypothetical protein [Cohnella sp. REN36]|uniref:hypothetical protein n=1 Tax=Cohnella sp. REN36 TaxID=2887347 RepID=UPI001D13B2D2|nr:hypothetical protein [Cohnella sp. REN36]MCC3376526.1 hypothetical protein [Cohnella sp. REN36]
MKTVPRTSQARTQAKRLAGQPVCVELYDGRYYVGWIEGMEDGQLVLAGRQGEGRMHPAEPLRTRRAKIAGLLPAVSAEGGAAAAEGAAAEGGIRGFGGFGLSTLTDLFGFMQKAMPVIKMGMNMVKSIMPLFGGLK